MSSHSAHANSSCYSSKSDDEEVWQREAELKALKAKKKAEKEEWARKVAKEESRRRAEEEERKRLQEAVKKAAEEAKRKKEERVQMEWGYHRNFYISSIYLYLFTDSTRSDDWYIEK